MRKYSLTLAVAATLLLPVAASATAGTTVDGNMAATTYETEDDDNDFPWGLLGLIGLAGLLGRKRDDHVHVDRRDNVNDGPRP